MFETTEVGKIKIEIDNLMTIEEIDQLKVNHFEQVHQYSESIQFCEEKALWENCSQ